MKYWRSDKKEFLSFKYIELQFYSQTYLYFSNGDMRCSHLPKSYFIKNYLRSNYYKKTSDINSTGLYFTEVDV
jgi:hypothetical protein